jgi:prefoldin subunit 4
LRALLTRLLWQKEKEDLDDVSNELELADEEDKIPYAIFSLLIQLKFGSDVLSSYKIGDSFITLPLPEVQEMLATSTTKIEEDVTALEEQLETIREEMTQLKVELYARFGRSINLET